MEGRTASGGVGRSRPAGVEARSGESTRFCNRRSIACVLTERWVTPAFRVAPSRAVGGLVPAYKVKALLDCGYR